MSALPSTRDLFRQTLADLAIKARETLPESNGRIESAVKIVLAGDVEMQNDGTAVVSSRTDPLRKYETNGTCTCTDYSHAPDNWCSHRIARALQIRCDRAMRTLLGAGQTPEPGPVPASLPSGGLSATPLPEAPCSANVHVTIGGKDVLVTVRGHSLAEVLPQIEAVVQRYPVSASTTPASQGEGSKQCPKHQVPMRLNHGKDGKSWWSHKLGEGWCKGR